MNRLVLVLLLAIPLSINAQVYKTVDEQGNTVFSDRPTADGSSEKINVGTINTTPPPQPLPQPRAEAEATNEQQREEVSVEIVSPAPETTIAIGYAGNFTVEAQVNPPLARGLYVQLLIDGTATGEPQAQRSWFLNNVFRGSHSLSVIVSNSTGDSLATSSPITIHVLRASVAK
jgi:hypothetical protein